MRGPLRATAALCALLATAGAARAQTPGATPPAPPPPAPPVAVTAPAARIFITSPRPGVKVFVSNPGLATRMGWEDYQPLCETPCNTEVSLDASLFADGNGMARSSVFRLPPAPEATGYRIDVRPGSSLGRTVSILSMVVGVAAIVTGIALHVDANQALSQYEAQPVSRPGFQFSDNERQHHVATGLLFGGWAAFIGSGLGLGLSTTVVGVKPIRHGHVIPIPGGVAF